MKFRSVGGYQKGDVKPQVKKPKMQQDIAAVGESLTDGLLQGLAVVVGMDGVRACLPPVSHQEIGKIKMAMTAQT